MVHTTPPCLPQLVRTTTAMLLMIVVWTVALPSLATAQVGGSVSGGWSPVTVTQNASSLLERALQNESSYREGVTARVCVFEIRSLSQQVVSGMNYRYDVQACPVSSVKSAGMCAVKTLTTNSSCNEYEIQLYDQSWTNTLQVTSIALLSQDANVGGDADANATTGSTSNDTSNARPSSATSDKTSSSSTVVAPSPTPLPTATKSSAVSAFSSTPVVLALVSVCLTALAAA